MKRQTSPIFPQQIYHFGPAGGSHIDRWLGVAAQSSGHSFVLSTSAHQSGPADGHVTVPRESAHILTSETLLRAQLSRLLGLGYKNISQETGSRFFIWKAGNFLLAQTSGTCCARQKPGPCVTCCALIWLSPSPCAILSKVKNNHDGKINNSRVNHACPPSDHKPSLSIHT